VVASSQIKFSREISKSRGEESAVKRARWRERGEESVSPATIRTASLTIMKQKWY
jgi:hypothetical protein